MGNLNGRSQWEAIERWPGQAILDVEALGERLKGVGAAGVGAALEAYQVRAAGRAATLPQAALLHTVLWRTRNETKRPGACTHMSLRLRQADRLEKANAVVIATRAGGDHMPFGLVSKKFGGQVPPGLRSPPPGSNARPLRVWDPPRLKYRSRVSAIALTRPAPPTGADGGAAGRGAWGNRGAARGLHQDRRLHRAAAGQEVGP
jgi:hypothetical protein